MNLRLRTPAFFLLIGLALAFGPSYAATVIADPIRDYLFSPDLDTVISLPAMGELYVLKCPLSENGKTAVLISSDSEGGRQGRYWTVYLPTARGYTKAEEKDGTMIFRTNMFYVGTIKGKYGLLAFNSEKSGGDLNFYQLSHGIITKRRIASLSSSDAGDQIRFDRYFADAVRRTTSLEHPLKTFSLRDLQELGYDLQAAQQAAAAANHPLLNSLGN